MYVPLEPGSAILIRLVDNSQEHSTVMWYQQAEVEGLGLFHMTNLAAAIYYDNRQHLYC